MTRAGDISGATGGNQARQATCLTRETVEGAGWFCVGRGRPDGVEVDASIRDG